MGEFNLNLSTRPFPAYRVANFLLLLFFVIVAGASAAQAFYFRDYSEKARSIRADERNAQAEKKRVGAELDKLGAALDRPDTTAKMTEIDYLNNLIIRKHFSWTQVFSNLEDVMPEDVHLISVTPEITKDKVTLKLETLCRKISDESEFIRRLQAAAPVFHDVIVAREERKGTGATGEIAVSMSVAYSPEGTPAPVAATRVAAEVKK